MLFQDDKFIGPEDISHLYDIIKTGHLGPGGRFDPYNKKGAANTDDGVGCFYLEVPFSEIEEVIGKDAELANEDFEKGLTLFSRTAELEIFQMKIGVLRHGQDTAVFEFDAQLGIHLGFDSVAEVNGHVYGYLDRFWHRLAVNKGRTLQSRDLSDNIGGQSMERQHDYQKDREYPKSIFSHGIIL